MTDVAKAVIGAAFATWFALGAGMLAGQIKLNDAIGDLRAEIAVLDVTLKAINERTGHYAALAARVDRLHGRESTEGRR